MARATNVSAEAIKSIERSLETRFVVNQDSKSQYESLAAIFNHFDRGVERKLLTILENYEADTAQKVRDLMFVFEDLIRLEPLKIQSIIRVADKNVLAMALKDASQNLISHIMQSMPERAQKLITSIMDDLGKVRSKDIHAAQDKVLEVVRDLVDNGSISIPSKYEENEVVE
jgi:flagellar motor switch protein FliG